MMCVTGMIKTSSLSESTVFIILSTLFFTATCVCPVAVTTSSRLWNKKIFVRKIGRK